MKLSKRLYTIANLVPEGVFLADVGSDHAYLPLFLIEKGKIKGAQAIENKDGPFSHTCLALEKANLQNQILATKADGISNLDRRVNAVAICGMGGLLSVSILFAHKENLDNVEYLILDPHRDVSEVRKKVMELGYRIEEEEMVYEDNIFYTILLCKKGEEPFAYNEIELRFGRITRRKKSTVYLAYLRSLKSRYLDLLGKNLDKRKKKEVETSLALVLSELSQMEAK